MPKYSVYIALFDAPPDIPLTLGDLVGRSFRTFRNQIYFVSTILVGPTILSTLSMAGVRWCLMHWVSMHSLEMEPFLFHSLVFFLLLAILAVAQWELAIRSVAVVRMALAIDAEYKQAYAYAKRRKWAAAVIYTVAVVLPLLVIVFWAALSAGFVYFFRGPEAQFLSVIFFSIVGLASTCTVCWTLLYAALAFTILACEETKLGVIWGRTYELTVHYLWRGGSFMILLCFTLFAVSLAVDLPLLTFSLIESWRHGFVTTPGVYEVPIYLHVMTAVWDSIINILLLGVALIAGGLYYNDLCLRLEGRDIVSRIVKLSDPSASLLFPPPNSI